MRTRGKPERKVLRARRAWNELSRHLERCEPCLSSYAGLSSAACDAGVRLVEKFRAYLREVRRRA